MWDVTLVDPLDHVHLKIWSLAKPVTAAAEYEKQQMSSTKSLCRDFCILFCDVSNEPRAGAFLKQKELSIRPRNYTLPQ